jgi:hypothetical protein
MDEMKSLHLITLVHTSKKLSFLDFGNTFLYPLIYFRSNNEDVGNIGAAAINTTIKSKAIVIFMSRTFFANHFVVMVCKWRFE